MNKDIVDCIQAQRDKEIQKIKEKDELIKKIYDFFDDLPTGNYHIDLVNRVEAKRKDHWYSKPYEYAKYIKKEPWVTFNDYITIEKSDKTKIKSGTGHFDWEISRWSIDEVQLFYDHLDWFEQELGKEYCNKK